ncbi:MAG TPA: DegT/DnrJ/EryC1/StrS family aminotransferase [Candidatus Lokiarchaeia archaeon]|nr:DegT/DnrJ/EryC1/StrS family aminotransferase [Candidatus Lokiarchaeia archaeon]
MKVPIVQLGGIIPPEVLDEVQQSLSSGMWADSNHIHELEEEFAHYIGVEHCRAMTSGTAALLSMAYAAGLSAGDEVIMPSFTFIATANCLWPFGAKPVFVDIDPTTFNLDPTLIEDAITPQTKAILPVHLFGLCSDMDPINGIAEKHGLAVLEDACQAHGATYGGKKAGNLGFASAFSLYPTKNMVCGGEGGFVTTNDETFMDKVKMFINHGQQAKYVHTALGFNFRLTEVAAVIAKWSLSVLDENNACRVAIAAQYNEGLGAVSQVKVPEVPEGRGHVFHQYTIRAERRDELATFLQDHEIGYGIHYMTPIHLQPYYKDQGYAPSLPVTEQTCKEVISLPMNPVLTDEQVEFVVATIKEFYEQ